MPLYTPRGLKLRISEDYAFGLMARLHGKETAFRVLQLTESGRDRSSRPPRLGERIGELVGLDYDGLIVPGVRGQAHEVYWNVVMFHPENRWLRLVDKSVQPKEVS